MDERLQKTQMYMPNRDVINLSLAARVDDTGVGAQVSKVLAGYLGMYGELPDIQTAESAKTWALTQKDTGLLDIDLPPQWLLGKQIPVNVERPHALGVAALADLYVETKTGDFATLLAIHKRMSETNYPTVTVEAWAMRGLLDSTAVTNRLRQVRLGFMSTAVRHYLDARTTDARFVHAMKVATSELSASLPALQRGQSTVRPWEEHMREPIEQW